MLVARNNVTRNQVHCTKHVCVYQFGPSENYDKKGEQAFKTEECTAHFSGAVV